jgi:hypothetical protein
VSVVRRSIVDLYRNPVSIAAASVSAVVLVAVSILVLLLSNHFRLFAPFALLASGLLAQFARFLTVPVALITEQLLSGKSPSEAIQQVRGRFSRRIVAVAVERALTVTWTVLLGSLLATVALGGATVFGYVRALTGVSAPQSAYTTTLLIAVGYFVLGSIIATPFRIGSAASAETEPIAAPQLGVHIARSNPSVTGLLLLFRTLPWLLVWVFVLGYREVVRLPTSDELLLTAAVAVFLAYPVTMAIQRRLVSAVHEETKTFSAQFTLPSARIVLASLLVVSLISAPTAAVRIEDRKPAVGTEHPITPEMTTDEIVSNAVSAAARTDHYRNATKWEYNHTTKEWRRKPAFDTKRDYSDKQRMISIEAEDQVVGTQFLSDGTTAFGVEGRFRPVLGGIVVTYADNWTSTAVPSGLLISTVTIEPSFQILERAAGEFSWTVLRDRNQTVTLGITDPKQLVKAFERVDSPKNVSEDSYVQMTVSKKTGRIQRMTAHKNLTAYGEPYRTRTVVRFREWKTYDLKRPAPIREPSLLELFWDAFGY